jgi:uncharacterized protein YodC (DUF2158 family)
VAENLKAGDVVRLKSGGPTMTVESVGELHGAPTVWCTWFGEQHKMERGDFPLDSLTPASDQIPKTGPRKRGTASSA